MLSRAGRARLLMVYHLLVPPQENMNASVCWNGRVTQFGVLPTLAGCRRVWLALQPATQTTFRHVQRQGLVSNEAAEHAAARAGSSQVEFDAAEFSNMLEQLRDWKERYYDCIVPRKVHDAGYLGHWVHRMRLLRRRGQLAESAVAQLDALGFSWEVDVVTAKWYHNLHAARRYRDVHGSCDFPPDYADPAHPDWVEAARWLERQRDLYRREKLLLVRVRLLKELLGVKLHREYSKPRRNLHPVLKLGNAQFRAVHQLLQPTHHRRQAAQQQQAGNGTAPAVPPQDV